MIRKRPILRSVRGWELLHGLHGGYRRQGWWNRTQETIHGNQLWLDSTGLSDPAALGWDWEGTSKRTPVTSAEFDLQCWSVPLWILRPKCFHTSATPCAKTALRASSRWRSPFRPRGDPLGASTGRLSEVSSVLDMGLGRWNAPEKCSVEVFVDRRAIENLFYASQLPRPKSYPPILLRSLQFSFFTSPGPVLRG